MKQTIVKSENCIDFSDALSKNMFNLFSQIEDVSGSILKMQWLSKANDEQQNLIHLACNPFLNFHITKWNETLKSNLFKNDSEAYIEFMVLTNVCLKENRSSSLQYAVENFFSKCNDTQEKWFSRILRKDLRFGLQTKNINKVFPKLIPTFDVMLAQKAEKDYSNVDFSRPLCIERKYDGFRVVVMCDEDEGVIEAVGRSGKPIINKEFKKKLEEASDKINGWVLDGEAYCHSVSFEELSSILRTEDKKLPADCKFYVFDVMGVGHWEQQYKDGESYFKRINDRDIICKAAGDFFISIPTFQMVAPASKAVLNFEYNQYLDEGYEGAMLKYLDAPYEWKRSKNVLKIKPEETIDLKVIGAYEGEGKYVGMLGGFICLTEDGVEVRVGGGYKEWERDQLWISKNYYLNRWMEAKYTEMTSAGSLRHPRFKRFRDDKD